MRDPERMRELARWYRDFAEKAGNLAIWDRRLRTADELDAEAQHIERTHVRITPQSPARATPPGLR